MGLASFALAWDVFAFELDTPSGCEVWIGKGSCGSAAAIPTAAVGAGRLSMVEACEALLCALAVVYMRDKG